MPGRERKRTEKGVDKDEWRKKKENKRKCMGRTQEEATQL